MRGAPGGVSAPKTGLETSKERRRGLEEGRGSHGAAAAAAQEPRGDPGGAPKSMIVGAIRVLGRDILYAPCTVCSAYVYV